ncbi:hypothetical protein D3C77_813880 [compost metagenome]
MMWKRRLPLGQRLAKAQGQALQVLSPEFQLVTRQSGLWLVEADGLDQWLAWVGFNLCRRTRRLE